MVVFYIWQLPYIPTGVYQKGDKVASHDVGIQCNDCVAAVKPDTCCVSTKGE